MLCFFRRVYVVKVQIEDQAFLETEILAALLGCTLSLLRLSPPQKTSERLASRPTTPRHTRNCPISTRCGEREQ